MRNRLLIIMALTISVSVINANSIVCHANGLTWEGLREYVRENGGPASAGTHTELSNCPGQDIPQNNSSTEQKTITKSIQEKTKISVHEHNYIETITKESTCVENGVKTFICSCGDKYTESIALVEHKYDTDIITKQNTCTEKGTRRIICSICHDTYEEDIEPLGHEKGEWVIAKSATCVEKGEEIVSCRRCGETLETRETEPLGHEQGEMATIQEATLFSKGLKETKCLTCGEVLASEEIPINMNTWYIIIGACLVVIGITTICVVRKRKKK